MSDGDLRDAVTKLAAQSGTFFGTGTKVGQPTVIGATVARPIARFIAMAPVQLRFTADVDWHRWSVAPRVAVVGAQRLLETTAADPGKRRTLAGYAVVDVNVRRRNLLKNIAAFVMLENAFDRRYRAINIGAYTNAEELIGSPQNPRRITVGFDLRLQ